MISVICPTLNEEENIRTLIESVLCQNEDFELLIMDGGSTDKTKEIAESFKDKRIKFINEIQTFNFGKGQVAAGAHIQVEEGRKIMKGDIFVQLPADNYFLPEVFKIVKEKINGWLVGRAEWSNGGTSGIDSPKYLTTPACFFERKFLEENNLKYEWEEYPEIADYIFRKKAWLIKEPVKIDKKFVFINYKENGIVKNNKLERVKELKKFRNEQKIAI